MIVSPDKFLPLGVTRPSRDDVALAWQAAHRTFAKAARRADAAGLLCGLAGSGKTTWGMQHDDDRIVLFDAVWSHRGARTAMARRIRAFGAAPVLVHVVTDVATAHLVMRSRSSGRRVPLGRLHADAARFAARPPDSREGWDRIVQVNRHRPAADRRA